MRRLWKLCLGITTLTATAQGPVPAADLAWAMHSEPKTYDPAKVDDQSSETVRFLTAGVLLRINRQTLQAEPELAERFITSPDGKLITMQLRKGLHFSDGSPLTSADAAASLRRVLDPGTAAPVAEEFLDPKAVTVDITGPLSMRIHLPKRIIGVEKVFDEIAIEPAGHLGASTVTAGPFFAADIKRGQYVLLRRNPYFWKKDGNGQTLPYLSGVRIDFLSNREIERVRFLGGQYQIVNGIAPEDFDSYARQAGSARDFGPSLNTEQMWFNQSAASPLPAYERVWFANQAFRQAVSMAIQRTDLARIAYKGHAIPAYSFISPANRTWHNASLHIAAQDIHAAQMLLQQAGFRLSKGKLVDSTGNAVRFSILTNAGNVARERMAELISQDLAKLGMQVNVVKLDFPALIDRLMHTQSYEAALLGLTNVDPDPNAMMNVWLSSSPNHQWNPSEKTPATPWEAEIDKLMLAQAAATSQQERKQCIDRVQQIVAEEQPFIYLVHPDLLYAVAPSVEGTQMSVLQPGAVAGIETMHRKAGAR